MARKKSKNSLFNEGDQEKSCIQYLKSRGYAVFKAGSTTSAEEEEAVRKLKAVGYKVEHIQDALVKVDPTQIKTVDDVAVYFHKMMERHNPKRHNPKRLKDKSLRLVDHSIINYFIGWKIDEGASLSEAIEEMFLLIDMLFEKKESWDIDIRGMGILSVNNNKPFVMALMREVKLKKDARLTFQVEQLLQTENNQNYIGILQASRERMDQVTTKTPQKGRKKVEVN